MPKPSAKPKRARTRPAPVPEAEPEPAIELVPEYIANAKLMKKKRLRRGQLDKFTEDMMLLNIPHAHKIFWVSLAKQMLKGHMGSLELFAKMVKMITSPGTISITQQMVAQQQGGQTAGAAMGMDAFVRQLALDRSGGQALALPPVVDVRPVNTGTLTPIPTEEQPHA